MYKKWMAFVLVLSCLVAPAAYAHGGHHNTHHQARIYHNNTMQQQDYSAETYTCYGYAAHEHPNGQCPYAAQAETYTCYGYAAHEHPNGQCPYAAQAETYTCYGYAAHEHPNGQCPYNVTTTQTATAVDGQDVAAACLRLEKALYGCRGFGCVSMVSRSCFYALDRTAAL